MPNAALRAQPTQAQVSAKISTDSKCVCVCVVMVGVGVGAQIFTLKKKKTFKVLKQDSDSVFLLLANFKYIFLSLLWLHCNV